MLLPSWLALDPQFVWWLFFKLQQLLFEFWDPGELILQWEWQQQNSQEFSVCVPVSSNWTLILCSFVRYLFGVKILISEFLFGPRSLGLRLSSVEVNASSLILESFVKVPSWGNDESWGSTIKGCLSGGMYGFPNDDSFFKIDFIGEVIMVVGIGLSGGKLEKKYFVKVLLK